MKFIEEKLERAFTELLGQEGTREVEREIDYYNLDVIILVGYRVKSPQGTQFRIWATQRLKEYIIKGFALNDDRFKSGNSMNYFNKLQVSIREIRISERFFYQKIKDIYTRRNCVATIILSNQISKCPVFLLINWTN